MAASVASGLGLLIVVSGLAGCRAQTEQQAAAAQKPEPKLSVAPALSPKDKVFQVGGDVSPPRVLAKPEQLIPKSCMNRQVTNGLGIYEAVITETGSVASVRTLKAPGFSPPCPEAAAEAIQSISKWKYEPARLKGTPVRVPLTVTQIIDVR